MATGMQHPSDVNILLKASHFAAEKHKTQRRKGDGSPYINHPVGVAFILQEEGKVTNVNILAGALLHDTVEDTDTSFEELEEHFGKAITEIVRDVTDEKEMAKHERKLHQIEHAAHVSKEAAQVKMADKLYNLRDLLRLPPKGWSTERVQGYFIWAKAVTDKLKGINSGLEAALDMVYATGTLSGEEGEVKAMPATTPEEFERLLKQYIDSMREVDD